MLWLLVTLVDMLVVVRAKMKDWPYLRILGTEEPSRKRVCLWYGARIAETL